MKTVDELAKQLVADCEKDIRLFGKVSRIVIHKALVEASTLKPPEQEKPKPAPKKEPEPHIVSPPLEDLEVYRNLQAAEGKLMQMREAVRNIFSDYESRHWHRYGTCVVGDFVNSERGCAVCIARSLMR